MPGMAEISALHAALSAGDPRKRTLLPLPLHSTVASSDQLAVFKQPPAGLRKVVIATNIAETSITIDDILFVIDSGRAKENRYDAVNRLPQLIDTWISTANRRQRRGRAGRVQPGEAFFMYTRARGASVAVPAGGDAARAAARALPADQAPRSRRHRAVPRRALEPPGASTPCARPCRRSAELQALEGTQQLLTPLGHHLATLPVDVRIGKMLIFGCMLRCLHPVLVIAAALSLRTPYSSRLTSAMRPARRAAASPPTRDPITSRCCACTNSSAGRRRAARLVARVLPQQLSLARDALIDGTGDGAVCRAAG